MIETMALKISGFSYLSIIYHYHKNEKKSMTCCVAHPESCDCSTFLQYHFNPTLCDFLGSFTVFKEVHVLFSEFLLTLIFICICIWFFFCMVFIKGIVTSILQVSIWKYRYFKGTISDPIIPNFTCLWTPRLFCIFREKFTVINYLCNHIHGNNIILEIQTILCCWELIVARDN